MPERGPSSFPYYRNDDAPAAVELLGRDFGLEKTMKVPGPDGTIDYAECHLGDAVFTLGSSVGEPIRQERTDFEHRAQSIYIAVDDVDACYERAKAAGAEVTLEIGDRPWGSRDFSVLDPEGYHWSLGTYRPS